MNASAFVPAPVLGSGNRMTLQNFYDIGVALLSVKKGPTIASKWTRE